MQDCELQLLAAWISGDNQEHIKDFKFFTYYPELFDSLRKIKGKIDILTVSKESGMKTSEIAKLAALYMPSLYDGYYRMKKEEKIKRMLLDASKSPDAIDGSIEAIYKEFETLQSTKIQKPTDLCSTYRKELEKRATIEPLKYGIPTMDYITGGIRRQELTIIAARPSIGKTALALQIAFNLALKKHKVLFFPLEMSGFQLMERIACRETNIQHEKLKDPSKINLLDHQALDHFFDTYQFMLDKHLLIIEKVNTLAGIKRHIEFYRPDIVFIDQLSQMKEHKGFGSLREQYSYMTNNVKAMTMDYDLPVILLAQLNRMAENKEPTFAELKESGSIEEDSDNVIMLHQSNDPIGEYTPVDLIIRKQRNGKRDVKIPCMYLNERFIFQETRKENGKGILVESQNTR